MKTNPCFSGGPWRNRTFNLLIKSQVLCLVELTAHCKVYERILDPCVWNPFLFWPTLACWIGPNRSILQKICRTQNMPFSNRCQGKTQEKTMIVISEVKKMTGKRVLVGLPKKDRKGRDELWLPLSQAERFGNRVFIPTWLSKRMKINGPVQA